MLGPVIRIETDLGFSTCSIKVNLSSPNTCSYTSPAWPRISGVRSSTEFWATPPQHSWSLII